MRMGFEDGLRPGSLGDLKDSASTLAHWSHLTVKHVWPLVRCGIISVNLSIYLHPAMQSAYAQLRLLSSASWKTKLCPIQHGLRIGFINEASAKEATYVVCCGVRKTSKTDGHDCCYSVNSAFEIDLSPLFRPRLGTWIPRRLQQQPF